MQSNRLFSRTLITRLALALGGLGLLAALLAARANFGRPQQNVATPEARGRANVVQPQQNVATPEASGQANVGQNATGGPPRMKGLVHDWTSHHVVFSNTDDPAVLKRIQHDPRYQFQLLRRR